MPTPEDEPISADIDSPSGHVAHAPARGKGYTDTGRWKGYVLYECLTCHFNSLNKTVITDHVERAAENNARLGR